MIFRFFIISGIHPRSSAARMNASPERAKRAEEITSRRKSSDFRTRIPLGIPRKPSLRASVITVMLICTLIFSGAPFIFLVPSLMSFTVNDAHANDWFSTAYKYRKKLTLDAGLISGSSNLSNFPILVSYTDVALKTVANGGKVEQTNGYDIVFTDSSHTPVKLDHEIEKYTAATGEIIMWVRIPTLSATVDSDIYLYYGNNGISASQENQTGVWDSSYAGVWHLKETSGAHIDSTSNPNDSTSVGVRLQGTAIGKINGADNFEENVRDHIHIANHASLNLANSWTLSAWMRKESNSGHDLAIVKTAPDNVSNYWLGTNGNQLNSGFANGSGGYHECQTSATNLNTKTWYYTTAVFDNPGNIITLYVNGTARTTTNKAGQGCQPTADPIANTGDLLIGADGVEEEAFDGLIDEARISNAIRSADWVRTEYDNMANQGTGAGKFVKTASTEEGAPSPTNASASVDTRWIKGGITGKNVILSVKNTETSTDPIQWVRITRPSAKYTLTAGFASGWSANVSGDAVIFTGGSIAVNGTAPFTMTLDTIATDEINASWVIDVDDQVSGLSPVLVTASVAGALDSGIDASPPTGVTVAVVADSSSQTTSTAAGSDTASGLHANPYWFDETTGAPGGTDSMDWQSDVSFIDMGLTPSTQYCYRVKGRDAVGNESAFIGPVCVSTPSAATSPSPSPSASPSPSPTTTTTPSPSPTTTVTPSPTPISTPEPIITSIPDSGIFQILEISALPATSTSIISWKTSKIGTAQIEYGTTTAFGFQGEEDTALRPDHKIEIIGLQPKTSYYFRVSSMDLHGNFFTSGSFKFTTDAIVPPPEVTPSPIPVPEVPKQAEITKVTVVAVRPTSVKITWQTDIPATSQIIYGTSPGQFSQATIESITLTNDHTITVSDLAPKTVYYFSAISRNAKQIRSWSEPGTFTTESLEIQTVVEIIKPAALPPGSPGTQIPKITAGETITFIPISPSAGDTEPPSVSLFRFSQNPTDNTSPTVKGRAVDKKGVIAGVSYSTDGGSTWHPVTQILGIGASTADFSSQIPNVREGNYDILFRARDNSGNIGKSKTEVLIVDILPPVTGANAILLGSQSVVPVRGGILETLSGITQRMVISAVGGAVSVEATARRFDQKGGETNFPFTYIPSADLWSGDLTFTDSGIYLLEARAIDGAKQESRRSINTVNVAQPGNISDAKTKTPVQDAKVSVFQFSIEHNDFILWPGEIFNQANPQKTDENGNYRFIVPPGKYYVKVEKEGYRTLYTSIKTFAGHTALNEDLTLTKGLSLPLPISFWGKRSISLWSFPDFFNNADREKHIASGLNVSGAGDALLDKPMHEFSLPDQNGSRVDIRYFRGRKTILSTWATWSPLAQIQIPILNEIQKRGGDDVAVILLSLQESQGVIQTYLRRGGYMLSSIVDREGTLTQSLPILTVPQHFFLDRKGIVREVNVGFLTGDQLWDALSRIP